MSAPRSGRIPGFRAPSTRRNITNSESFVRDETVQAWIVEIQDYPDLEPPIATRDLRAAVSGSCSGSKPTTVLATRECHSTFQANGPSAGSRRRQAEKRDAIRTPRVRSHRGSEARSRERVRRRPARHPRESLGIPFPLVPTLTLRDRGKVQRRS